MEKLREEVQSLQVKIAVLQTKIGFIGVVCGIAGAGGVEWVKHLVK